MAKGTIYKWKAFGKQHVYVPKGRGGTTAAKARAVAKKQWKRKKFSPTRTSKMDWGIPGEKAYTKGYVVAGNLREPGKKSKAKKPRRVGRLVLG